jgi:hypothetical protein
MSYFHPIYLSLSLSLVFVCFTGRGHPRCRRRRRLLTNGRAARRCARREQTRAHWLREYSPLHSVVHCYSPSYHCATHSFFHIRCYQPLLSTRVVTGMQSNTSDYQLHLIFL